MNAISDSRLYRLVEEGSGTILVEASAISGFFVGSDHARVDDILISGSVREAVRLGEDISDVELRVVNSFGEAIGSYYIGRMALRHALLDRGEPGPGGFAATFYGYRCEYEAADAIWRRWASTDPIELGEWVSYPVGSRASWLHVVQNSWFERGREAKKYGAGEICAIDGRQILDESSFYCALGEAVNGPGGYYGATLDGLADCVASSGRPGSLFKLVWKHFSSAESAMGASLAASVLDVLSEFGVEVMTR